MIPAEYNFLVTNLRTHKVIAEVNLQSMRWNELLGRPGGGRFTARITDRKTTPENFTAWETGLWVARGNDLEFGGFLGPIQPRAGTGIIEGPVLGFAEYMRMRLIVGVQGMTNAVGTGNDITWTNKDDFLIADDLVNHSQRGVSMGLEADWVSLSGKTSDLTLHTWDYKKCGDEFEQFAARADGFSWWPVFFYDANNTDPRVKLMFQSPRRGRKTDFRFTFDNEPRVKNNVLAVDADGGKMPLTGRLGVVGSGEGDAMIRSNIIVEDGTTIEYDDSVAFKDVTVKATLTEKGDYIRLQRQAGQGRIFTCDMDWNMMPEYSQYAPGDEVNLFVDYGWLQVQSLCTITSKEIVLSSTGDPQVKVTLAEMSFLDTFGAG